MRWLIARTAPRGTRIRRFSPLAAGFYRTGTPDAQTRDSVKALHVTPVIDRPLRNVFLPCATPGKPRLVGSPPPPPPVRPRVPLVPPPDLRLPRLLGRRRHRASGSGRALLMYTRL